MTNTNEEDGELKVVNKEIIPDKEFWKWAYLAIHPVKFKMVHPDAVIPVMQREGDACYDLYSVETVHLGLGMMAVIDTGLQMEMPVYLEARIRPRSGLAAKHGIVPVFGTIDSGYRGNVKVMLSRLFNTTSRSDESQKDEAVTINTGDRIAQMSFHGRCYVEFEVVEELNDTERGEGGFGSTGQ